MSSLNSSKLSFQVGRKQFPITIHEGEVTGITTKAFSSTSVHSSGSRIYSQSHENEETSFFLITDNGYQKHYTLRNWGAAVGNGHRVKIISITAPKGIFFKGAYYDFAMVNYATGNMSFNNAVVGGMAYQEFQNSKATYIMMAIALVTIPIVIGLLIPLFWFQVYFKFFYKEKKMEEYRKKILEQFS